VHRTGEVATPSNSVQRNAPRQTLPDDASLATLDQLPAPVLCERSHPDAVLELGVQETLRRHFFLLFVVV
jgi:hypothetical protein